MKTILIFLIVSFASVRVLATPVLDCYGGDGGPGPAFKDISSSLVAKDETISTMGDVQDFIYLEGKESLVYRNNENRLWATSVPCGDSFPLGDMAMPLSPLVDSAERYLVSDGMTWLFDLKGWDWIHFTGPTGPIEHLFWYRSVLYSLSSADDGRRGQSYRLYGYAPGDTQARSCTFSEDNDFQLVRGRTPPFLVFFKEESAAEGGRRVTFRRYTMDCRQFGEDRTIQVRGIPPKAPLEGADYIGKLHAIALRFDYPKKNLVWVRWGLLGPGKEGEVESPDPHHDGCKFLSVQSNAKPVFLSERDPVMAMWTGKGDLDLYYLDKQERARVVSGLAVGEGDPHSLWLSRDGTRLFVAPKIEGRREIRIISLGKP